MLFNQKHQNYYTQYNDPYSVPHLDNNPIGYLSSFLLKDSCACIHKVF